MTELTVVAIAIVAVVLVLAVWRGRGVHIEGGGFKAATDAKPSDTNVGNDMDLQGKAGNMTGRKGEGANAGGDVEVGNRMHVAPGAEIGDITGTDSGPKA